jgi:hypothetical protein
MSSFALTQHPTWKVDRGVRRNTFQDSGGWWQTAPGFRSSRPGYGSR